MTLLDILGIIFNAAMIGVGTAIGNYIATRHLIGMLAKVKKIAKEKKSVSI